MTQNEEVGKAMVDLLNLKKKKGFYITSWGRKSLEGLGASVIQILVDEASLYIE